MNHPFTFIKSRAWLYFVHRSLWMFTVDEMRMKTAFTPFTLDESSAMHIQSVKRKFTLTKYRHNFSTVTIQFTSALPMKTEYFAALMSWVRYSYASVLCGVTLATTNRF